jgi:hypothetical protein
MFQENLTKYIKPTYTQNSPRANPRLDGKMGVVLRQVVQGSDGWRKATREGLILG